MVARAIHLAGLRPEGPFVTVNCAALPETLLESELFGHKRGAFTGAVEERKGRFELASGGTIFLDEVGDIPLPTQVKLLRVLQEKKFERLGENRTLAVDVRIIAATNADLERLVEDGRFREDLFYRLNVIPLYLPPLRDRREDIIPLTEYFLDRFNKEHAKGVSFTPEAIDLLRDYRWAGNVRELENLVERTVVMAKASSAGISDLPRAVRLFALSSITEEHRSLQGTAADGPTGPGENRSLSTSGADHLRAMEKEELRKALESTGWVIARAAKILGWTPRQVAYKMKKHSLKSPWKP
jgi:Nif-specific regulatory protein